MSELEDSYFQWFQSNGLHALAKSWKKALPLSMTELLQGMLNCDSEQRPNLEQCDLEWQDDFGGWEPWWAGWQVVFQARRKWHHLTWLGKWFTEPIRWLQLVPIRVITRLLMGILEIWDGYFLKSTFLAGRISTPWFFLVWLILMILEIPFVLTIYLSHVQKHRKT